MIEKYYKQIENLKNNQKIIFERNEYNIFENSTSKSFVFVSNNDSSDKDIFAVLKNKKNIIIDGNNSTLVFHKRITSFYIDDCKNIKIKNFKIKYNSNYYFQAEIIKKSGFDLILKPLPSLNFKIIEGSIVLYFNDETLDYRNKTVYIQEFDKEEKCVAKKSAIQIVKIGYKDQNPKERYYVIDETLNGLVFKGNFTNDFTVGNILCLFCEKRVSDCFIINDSKNIKMKNIYIENSPAMGIIAQVSENIRLENLFVHLPPKTDKYITTLADATHFVNCSGKIIMKNCIFENMNDDASNIHGMYLEIRKIIDSITIEAEIKHFQQYGINIFKNKDKVCFLNKNTHAIITSNYIKNSISISKNIIKLKFYKKIKNIDEGDIIENYSRMPRVYISGCKTGNNRPRGFLIATPKKAIIKNCDFYNSECGVGIFADTKYWFEAGAVKNVIIKNNRFKSNYGGADSAISILPSIKNIDNNNYFNKNVKIKNNNFIIDNGKAVEAENLEKIIIKKNLYIKNGVAIKANKKDVISIKHCKKIIFKG